MLLDKRWRRVVSIDNFDKAVLAVKGLLQIAYFTNSGSSPLFSGELIQLLDILKKFCDKVV
jgi:hypothetical protein